MKTELDKKTYAEITRLCEKGDGFVEHEQFEKAIESYLQAFNLIPEPFQNWEAATWVLTALGETYFFMDDFEKAHEMLQNAMHCPDAIGNPLIHLRLGQVQYELGNIKKAKDELMRAYMGGGIEIFDDEEEKYFACVRDSMR